MRISWLLLLSVQLPLSGASSPSCPCDHISLCQTIPGLPVAPNGEVYGFYERGSRTMGQDMNWTHVTTVAWADHDEVMCLAHKHKARAVIAAPSINLTALADPLKRKIWIQKALDRVLRTYRDGLVFDYESPLPSGSLEGQVYAKLVAETRHIFQQVNPSLQISTCVAWSPNNIDGRDYPYKELAEASDILYVMDYDTRSQIYGDCIAGANAPLEGMKKGMTEWVNLGIEPSKLILGVPWYGYKYPCLPGTSPDIAAGCPIQPVPFRGVNCSDAAGSQIGHAAAIQVMQKNHATAKREEASQSLFFNTVVNGTVYQYWMEDAVLLRKKYKWAREKGLAGVGPYTFQYLDPIHQPEEAQAMWSAFDDFTVGNPALSNISAAMLGR